MVVCAYLFAVSPTIRAQATISLRLRADSPRFVTPLKHPCLLRSGALVYCGQAALRLLSSGGIIARRRLLRSQPPETQTLLGSITRPVLWAPNTAVELEPVLCLT
jgi:hypothetical protein